MYMTKKSVFEVIQTILRNCKFPVTTRKNAIVLVSAILYQNSKLSHILHKLKILIKLSILETQLFKDTLNSKYNLVLTRFWRFYSLWSFFFLNFIWDCSRCKSCNYLLLYEFSVSIHNVGAWLGIFDLWMSLKNVTELKLTWL